MKFRLEKDGKPVSSDPKGPPKLIINYIADRETPDVSYIEKGKSRARADDRGTGAPKGNRTPVFAVKGRRPGPLDDGRGLLPCYMRSHICLHI